MTMVISVVYISSIRLLIVLQLYHMSYTIQSPITASSGLLVLICRTKIVEGNRTWQSFEVTSYRQTQTRGLLLVATRR